MGEQFGEKTHDATPHRRQQARDEGQVPRSQDLTSAITLIVAIWLLMTLGKTVIAFLGSFTEQQLGAAPVWQMDIETATTIWNRTLLDLGRTLVPVMGLLMLAAVLSNLGQSGLLFLPQKVAFNSNHINPLKGLQRIFALSNVMRTLFGIFKILLIVVVAAASLWNEIETILGASGMDALQLSSYIVEVTLWTCLKIGVALLILALLDYAYQRWKHEQDLKMTNQEMREEMKTLQGDPQIIARRRQAQRQMALNRMSSAIPKADVVVTNPTELAIAIQYDMEKMIAPVVVAKGAGVVAQRIRRLALENNIPIVERKELARFLYKEVEVNGAIPPERYAAVAEVLRYVYDLQGKPLPKAPKAA